MIELTKRLVETWGPPGYEHRIRDLIREEVADLADETWIDGLGNLICRVGNAGKKVLVAAHMDEIGLMANYQEPESGYLRFTNLGGLRHDTLHGNRVQFEDGTVGVIAVQEGGGKSLSDFYIDVQAEAGGNATPVGQPAGFMRELQVRGKRLVAKSLDDRIGCVVAIEAMRRLGGDSPNTLYFAFTVQEEVGLRGAKTAAQGVHPDIGIAIDVTGSGDQIRGSKMLVQLGGGAAIKVHDPGLVVPAAIKRLDGRLAAKPMASHINWSFWSAAPPMPPRFKWRMPACPAAAFPFPPASCIPRVKQLISMMFRPVSTC